MKRYSKSFARLSRLSTLSIICTVVAAAYICYRGFALFGTNGVGSLFRPTYAVVPIGCGNDTHNESSALTARPPYLSQNFQDFLIRQPAIGPNLLPNTTLATLDATTATPANYYRTEENSALRYHLQYDEFNSPYLSLDSTVAGPSSGAWVTDTPLLQTTASYRYSFSYRSTVPTTVTAEYIDAKRQSTYETVAQLDATTSWQPFTSYFDNTRSAVGFRFIITPLRAGQVDTRDFSLQRIDSAQLSTGIVSVTFDDGWQSIADQAWPLLHKYGIRTTQYIISEVSEKNVGGYMSDATIKQLRQQGHEIASHSLLHCDQTKMSKDELSNNALKSKQQLEAQGLGPITSFAYPYGAYNKDTQQIFTQNYSLVRTSDEGFNDRYFDTQRIKSFAIHASTTDASLQSLLEHAKQHRQWLVLVYHRVNEQGEYSISSHRLDTQLRMIKNSGLLIHPVSEAAQKIRK